MVLKTSKLKDNPKIKRTSRKNPTNKKEKNENTITELFKRQHQKAVKTTTTVSSNTKNSDEANTSYNSLEPGISKVDISLFRLNFKC